METTETVDKPKSVVAVGSTDLLGIWHVYQINDCDWWLARSMDEAKEAALKAYSRDEYMIDDPRELTQADLERIQYHDEYHRAVHSFAVELEIRVAAGPKVELFASTEY
jgi:hypothetical protein